MQKICIAENPESLAHQAADIFVDIANSTIRNSKGHFSVALSGGSTPKALYSLLASDEYSSKVDWSKVRFFFGDERNVPDDDARSNYRMARETLFEPLQINESNVSTWITELGPPDEVAEMYELAIRMAFDHTLDPARNFTDGWAAEILAASQTMKDGLPEFDLILLGLGADGHTASLFPHTKALDENEKLAVANWVPQMDEHRFTMTFPLINNAANVMFLASGNEKAEAVKNIIEGEFLPDDLPAQHVKPVRGKLIWMLDASSAALLHRN